MRSNQVIVVFLALNTLLIGVPARQHSHAAGDRPHSHGHGQQHLHEQDGISSSVAHMHVALFGVEFTLPVESNDNDSHEGQATFLVASPPAIDMNQASHFAHLAQPVLDVGRPVQAVAIFRCIAASAAPLCDSARHERSGVLVV
jgi:hypothetical protein